MSATNYPNLFTTKDFRDLKPATDLAPQKEFNWYTSELIRYSLADKRPGEAILYKPENFDSLKKYPVIFFYYDKTVDDLNVFLDPDLTQGTMNIPWYLSHGYLVCVPEIYYTIGFPGRSALESVEPAARLLSKKSWVDAKKLGLQGHSYGGFETNYIVSHSNIFAAAAPASGMVDLVNDYGQFRMTQFFERRQGRIGATLWQRPDLYIENSPIFHADKVNAAVFIMHTTGDGICSI